MSNSIMDVSRNSPELQDAMIRAELEQETLCPFCGCAYLVPGTVAADRFGCCMTCYERAKARAQAERMRALVGYRKNGEIRKAMHDARARDPTLGVPPRIDPIF